MKPGYWITKSDGIVSEKQDNKYSNEKFVRMIEKDTTPMGKLMRSRFPTVTDISTINNEPPEHWVYWDNDSLDIDKIDASISILDEIPADKRFYVGRGEISSRTREVLAKANMIVTPRGIKDNSHYESPEDTLVGIVYCMYHLVEKHTLASLKSRNALLSSVKKNRFLAVHDILSTRGNVLDVALLSSYIEPSPMVMSRAYYVGVLYGMGITHSVINDLYHRHFHQQVQEVIGSAQFLN